MKYIIVKSLNIYFIKLNFLLYFKDKSQCSKFKTDFENSCALLEEFLNMLQNMGKQRAELVNLMEKSEIFYEAQFNDAKKVNNVSYELIQIRARKLIIQIYHYLKFLKNTASVRYYLSHRDSGRILSETNLMLTLSFLPGI